MQPFVYLASQSPRRAQLLEQLGVRFERLLPEPHEDAEAIECVISGEAPKRYVQRVTRLKLQAALARLKTRGLSPAPVLCSDTTVALGRDILGKPQDHAHAVEMLSRLSGQTHRVLTAVAVATPAQQQMTLSESRVQFAVMTRAEIEAYVASGEPMGKAGAYAIQGRATRYIPRIQGSYTGIIGLPLYETAQVLQHFGWQV